MKKLFRKIKMDVKFARAGEGHKLTDDTRTYRPVASNAEAPIRTRPMSSSQAQAGAAAIARHEQRSKQTKTVVPKVIKSRPGSEESERKSSQSENNQEKTIVPSVDKSVMFHSPFNDEIVTKKDLKSHMRENLILLLSENPIEASSLMIETLNSNREKKDIAITTLNKYLDNIISHPDEEKYAKIRKNNRIFSERVAPIEGCEEFLEGIGYKRTIGENDEIFFVLENVNVEKIAEAKEALSSAKGLEFRIYRDAQICIPNPGQSMRFDVPAEFFSLTSSEIKQEHEKRVEEVELNKQLRTKAMREAGNVNYKSNYTIIRVRFPDERLLQAENIASLTEGRVIDGDRCSTAAEIAYEVTFERTFRANETIEDLKSFVREHINVEWAVFYLRTPIGEYVEEDEATLLSVKLVPTAVLNLSWNEEIRLEILKEQGVELALREDRDV